VIGDVFRWISAVAGLVLVSLSWGAIVLSPSWHQRVRLFVAGGLAGLVATTALGALGREARWETYALTGLVVVGIAGTVPLIVCQLRDLARGDRSPPG
jgi:hypothetical protein